MIIIPAIDLKEGRCVRLVQGRMDQESVYSENPVETAKHWQSKGAERLHVVDLNGAVEGRPLHRDLIVEIAHSVSIPVEVGGGIRDLETIENYLSSGVGWVILGTAALLDRSLVEKACQRFPEKIIIGVDARKGKVAVEGWKKTASTAAVDLVRQFERLGISAVIYTDIERDGTGKGLNLTETKRLAQETSIPVIASGGISRAEEIERVRELSPFGVIGAIIGRALYTGQIALEEAIRIAKTPMGSTQSQAPNSK